MVRQLNMRQVLGTWMMAMTIAFMLLAATGCGENSPTNTTGTAVTLSQARITVGDQSLDGQTMHQGQQTGTMRYEAHLVDRRNEPVPGYAVRVRVEWPGMMGSMHHMTEDFFCYDDGTHGDPVPGDGIYCYEDPDHDYGCHRADAQPGDYHYDFCGVDEHGHESNHMDLMIRLVP